MSNIPARVAADAAQADAQLAELAAAAADPQSPALSLVEGGVPPPAPVSAPPSPPQPGVPPPAPAAVPVDLAEELRRSRDFIAAQNGRLQAQADSMRELQRSILELQANRQPAPQPQAPQFVTEKDREEYGDDLLALIIRVIKQELGGPFERMALRINALEQRVGTTSKTVENVQQYAVQTADERYFNALDARIPDWEAVNDTQHFVDWLKNQDKLSGETYYNLLAYAHQQRDVGRVVEIFRVYKPELIVDSPAAPAPSTPKPQQPSGRIDPHELAAPVTSAPAPAPSTPAQGPIWTQADVNKLYDDKVKGRTSQADFDRLEKQYHQALLEGRVSLE
jgi:hypothetical protein